MASVAAIRTQSYKFALTLPPRGRVNGLYRRSGNDFSLKVSYDTGDTQTAVSAGGRAKFLFKQNGRGQPPHHGIVEADDGDLPIDCNPNTYNLLRFYAPLKFRSDLSEILAQPCTCRYVGPVQRAGRTLERVELSHARADQTIDFDPSVNYLARVVVLRSKLAGGAGKPLVEQEVTEFTEVAPGVYFPARVRCVDPATGEQSWLIEFTDSKTNQPIPPETFEFNFPPGVTVADKLRGGIYVTDASGAPTKPATTKDGQPILMGTGALPSLPDDPEMPARPSRFEAGSLTRWVLPVALALLALGIVIGAVQRVRRGRSR